MDKTDKTFRKNSVLAKTARVFAVIILSLISLVVLILVLIQTRPVQNFARKKIVSFLQDKLQTRVELAGLDIDFPKKLVLEGVYIEDRNKDTLVAGSALKVDMNFFQLLKGNVQINELDLSGITLKIKRELPDTTFNFQFIADAFATTDTTAAADTSATSIAIDNIVVDKTRLVYKDVVTGNDVDIYLHHFDTHITRFDVNNMAFTVPHIRLNGLRGTVRQFKPLEITAVVQDPDTLRTGEPPAYLAFSNDKTFISDIDISYNNEIQNLKTNLAFKSLVISPKNIDLEHAYVLIDEITLQGLATRVDMGKPASNEAAVKLTDENRQEVETVIPWRVRVNKIRLDDNNVVYNDNTMPRQPRGMDFAHLGINNLTFHLNDFYFHNDTINGHIVKAGMTERSGFRLNNLTTRFAYNNKGAAFNNLLVQTPGTVIRRRAVISYPSLEAIQKNPGLVEMNIHLDGSRIQVRDILYFMPELAAEPAFSNPSAMLYVDGIIKGSVARLSIERFRFRGFADTELDMAGTIYGLPDATRTRGNISLRTFKTSRADILSLAPPNTLPPNITLPANMQLSGTLQGSQQKAVANLQLRTSLGNASLKGFIANATNKETATYQANIAVDRLDVGTLIQDTATAGLLTANISVEGKGYNPDKTTARFTGNVASAKVMGYEYRNLQMNGMLNNQQFAATASIRDPNIHLTLEANGDMGGELPGFELVANIDSIKTQPLHLTPDPIVYRGKIEASFPQLNPDALNGSAYITNSLLVMNGQRVVVDSLSLISRHEGTTQTILLRSPFMHASIAGQYKLAQLGDIMMESINPYYTIVPADSVKFPDPYAFTIQAGISDHPALHAFVPTLTRLEPVTLSANFSTAAGTTARLTAPYIAMGQNIISNVDVSANTTVNNLEVVATVEQVKSGTSFIMYNTSLGANIHNNNIDFGLLIKDKLQNNQYRMNGLLAQAPDSAYTLQLRPDSLLLNYNQWNLASDNQLTFGPLAIHARNFRLSRDNQVLLINSTAPEGDSPMEVRFSDFRLATLTNLVQSDSLSVDGTINGNVMLNDLLTRPTFVTDLTVNTLSFNNDTLGNLTAKINNTTPDVFNTNISLTGNGNDVSLAGNYYLEPADNNNLDLVLNIKALQMKSLEGPSFHTISNASGYLSGSLAIKGSADAPAINGGIDFNNTRFVPTMLGDELKIDNETIRLDEKGIHLSTFTVRDSANNQLVVDGDMLTTNFINYQFNLNIKADDFRAINSTAQAGALYYGQLYFDCGLNIKGTETAPVIDGSIRINEETNLSMVVPQPEPGLVERTGVIEFVDMDAPNRDSLFLAATQASYDSAFNQSKLVGFDISTNIEIDKEATFNVIIDEANGDFLALQGEAMLTGGIDPSGKVTMTGTYTIESGSYQLSFNLIKRKFEFQKGSKITWTGEPTTGNIEATAIYVANTAPVDLVANQLGADNTTRYQQKLPFEVHLKVSGELMEPNLSFDIILPTDKNLRITTEVQSTVTAKLEQLRNEPSELNKQVFALLLLNRFVSDNPFQSSGGEGFSAAKFAKQSVSRILTEQLNKLASDLVGGVEINFDINSTDDYTTGTAEERTDFNVNLSKRLLNDRLRVSVGSTVELEGPQQPQNSGNNSNVIGNVTVDYMLTKDGGLMLRGYRKNNYEAIVEGFVVETGLRFIMSVDYNKLSQIFNRKKEKKKQVKELADSTRADVSFLPPPARNGEPVALTNTTEKTMADNRTTLPRVQNHNNNDEQ